MSGRSRRRSGPSHVRGRALQRAGADLVEARAAVHRSVVAWRERDHGLAAAGAADRGVELTGPLVGSGSLGGGSARRAALRVVDQALAGIEGLLASREDEFLGAIATGQRTVFVHPLQTSSARSPRPVETAPPWTGLTVRGRLGCGRRARCRSGLGPGLIAEKIRAPVKAFGQRSPQ